MHDDIRVLADALLSAESDAVNMLRDMGHARRQRLAEALLRLTYGPAWWLAWTVWLSEAVRQRWRTIAYSIPLRGARFDQSCIDELRYLSADDVGIVANHDAAYAKFAERQREARRQRNQRKRARKHRPKWQRKPRD